MASAWRRLTTTAITTLAHILNPNKPQPHSSLSSLLTSTNFSTSFLVTKTPKKYKKKKGKKDSPRTNPVQHDSQRLSHLEAILQRDAAFRFLTRTKEYLYKQPDHVLRLDDAGKLHRELGFPRGRKFGRFTSLPIAASESIFRFPNSSRGQEGGNVPGEQI
ncbi:hypothetical protein C3L33_10678, partial [Rhododendron williamsianum]